MLWYILLPEERTGEEAFKTLIFQAGGVSWIGNLQYIISFFKHLQGGAHMAVSYKKLWKLLIDKDMKKSDLECQSVL